MMPESIATRSVSWANHALLQVADRASRQYIMKFLKFYSDAQWWPREKLVEFQTKKLQELLATVERDTLFYAELFKRQNVTANKLKTISDLEYFPMVSKQDFKEVSPDKYLRKTGKPEKTYFTSGSSGSPFGVRMDNVSMSQARALMILRAQYSGWDIGDPVFQTGMSLKRGLVKGLKDKLFRTYYASAYDLSNQRLDMYLEIIDRKKIAFLMGYPGSIFALADRAAQVGFKNSMKGIVTWGDNLYDTFRKTIEQQFKCRVTDTYGCGEGIQVAVQCPGGTSGYHIFMPHVIVEIVDDAGVSVKRGQQGNILLTKLEPGAMPLIRYKVGDVGCMAENPLCQCGRGLDMLASIDGRMSDFIYTPGGNRLIVHFFTGILEYYPQIQDFQVVQKSIEEIIINVVPDQNFDEAIFAEIRSEIQAKGDNELQVEFHVVAQIDVPKTGKRKFVLSEIDNGK